MPEHADRPRGRRFGIPFEVVLIGVACLACCLPLIGGGLAALGGLLAAGTAIAVGLTAWLAAGLGIVVAALVALAWRWQARRGPHCRICGGRQCAC